MKKLKRLLILFLFLFPSLYSQYEGKARMQGIVRDENGNPLADVKVTLLSLKAYSGFETKTDKKGVWKAMWIRGGKWNIDFEKAGYEPKKISVTLKEDPKPITIETTLKKLKGPALKKDLLKDFEKGNRLFNEKKFAEALKIYESILEKFPDTFVIYLNVGNCYFEMQEYEKAIQAYLEVVEKEPQHTDAIISIGNSYSNMKQTEKALEWYKKIEIAKINDPVVLYNIGIFYFNSGDAKGAIGFLKRSTRVKENFPDGWYQLGMAYMSAGDNNAAITTFETYLKHDSQSETAKQVREILQALKE